MLFHSRFVKRTLQHDKRQRITPRIRVILDSFEQFPLINIAPEAFSLLIPSLFGTISVKKSLRDSEPVKTEDIMAGAVQRGLSLSDLDNLTLGQFVDYVVTYYEGMEPAEKQEYREAEQADFDRF